MTDSNKNIQTALGGGSLALSGVAFHKADKLDKFLFDEVPRLRNSMIHPIKNMGEDQIRGRFREATDAAERFLRQRSGKDSNKLMHSRNQAAVNALRNLGIGNISLPPAKTLTDSNNSLWHMMKAYGFSDTNPEHLKMLQDKGNLAMRNMAKETMGGFWKHRKLISRIRPLIPVVPSALALGGVYGLSQGLSKGASFLRDDDTTGQSLASGMMGVGGGGLGYSGIKDLLNRNVLLTYGDADILGGGHKATAGGLEEILSQVKTENPSLSKMKVFHGPMDMGGQRFRDPSINSRKYLMALDPGWGAFDDFRNERAFMRDGWMGKDVNTGLSDLVRVNQSTGKLEGNTRLGRNVMEKFIIQPDGMSETSGYRPSGIAAKTVPLGRKDYRHAWYGTVDPYGDFASGKGYTHFTGKHHPLIQVSDIPEALSREAHAQKVHEYIKTYAPEGMRVPSVEELAKKDIYTISGASRGDTVGIRSREMLEAIRKGKMDNAFILGIGSGGMERERAIANGIKNYDNLFIGGRPGGPAGNSKDFANLANNSKLHYMGLGGSTPFEMVGHGGAPIVTPKSEQVFYGRSPWSGTIGLRGDRGYMDETKGLHGSEIKRIEELKAQAAKLPEDSPVKAIINKLKPGEQRDWMNVVQHSSELGDDGKPKILRRGLDGIRDVLQSHGVREVESADDIVKLLGDQEFLNKSKWVGESTEARKGMMSSKAALKDLLGARLTALRSKAMQRGGAKLVGAAGLLGGAGYMFNEASKPQPWYKFGSMMDDLRSKAEKSMQDYRNDRDINYPGSLAATAGAAASADTYNQLNKAAPHGAHMSDLVRRVVDDRANVLTNPSLGGKYMDEYADVAKKLMKTRILGIPSTVIANKIPFSGALELGRDPDSLTSKIKDVLRFAIGKTHTLSPSRFGTLEYSRQHYDMFGKGLGGQAAINESVAGMPHRIGNAVFPNIEKAFSPAELEKFLDLPEGGKLEKHIAGLNQNQYNQTILKRIKELFFMNPGGQAPAAHFLSKDFNPALAKVNGPHLYAAALNQMRRFGKPLMAASALGLGSIPAIDVLKSYNTKNKFDPRAYVPDEVL